MPKQQLPSPIFDTLDNFSISQSDEKIISQKDYNLASEFLKQYNGNNSTYNCYRREVERLLHWTWLVKNSTILELKREEIEEYIKFCMKPPKSWIALKKFPRFKNINGQRVANEEWRPFVTSVPKNSGLELDKNSYQLSQKSVNEIFVALSSFYNFLSAESYITINPVQAIKQKSKFIRKNQTSASVRRLTETQWQYVLDTARSLAATNPNTDQRTLFVISALYLMYLRVSELVAADRWSPQMNHFYQDSYHNWWFKTVGKGNKERSIAVNSDMLKALMQWRAHLGLSPALPSVDDDYPLVPKLRGHGNVSDTKLIYNIVQKCFNTAIENLKKNNELDEAINLSKASSHWLRHTGISDSINKYDRPIAHVRDDAGHASIVTTDRYNDITLLERHESAQKNKIDVE